MITFGGFAKALAGMMLFAALATRAMAQEEPDPLLNTPVTAEVLTQGAEADAYAQGFKPMFGAIPWFGWSAWRGNIQMCRPTARRPAIARL